MSDNMGRRGGHGGPRMMAGEKAKDFKGSMAKLLQYMAKYKIRFVIMFVFAIAGTVFNIVGPKILGKATTELFNGLVAKSEAPAGSILQRSRRSCCLHWDCMSAHRYFLLFRDLS